MQHDRLFHHCLPNEYHEYWYNHQTFYCKCELRDRGDHFKVVGLKTLANIKKHSGRCFAIYLAFAGHLILYHPNKYNKNVHTCYTIQYSQYVTQTSWGCYNFLKLPEVPKLLLRFLLRKANSCVVIETLSVLRLWPCSTARSPILDGTDRSHVFRCRADENERSPATLVAGFTGASLQIVWASWISFSSSFGNFDTAFRISSKHAIFSYNLTSKILSCMPG